MNEERFNISLRKFLKQVGVTSQREIERVVREENLAGKGKLKVRMVLTAECTTRPFRRSSPATLSACRCGRSRRRAGARPPACSAPVTWFGRATAPAPRWRSCSSRRCRCGRRCRWGR